MAQNAAATSFFSSENPLFSTYAFYASVLVLKMFVVTILTAKQRMTKKVFANPEDAKMRGAKVNLSDPDVERVRRAHLNDLENIPAFLFVSFLYIFTNPSLFLAVNLFRAFTAARILHTIVYAVVPLPQPSRGLAFGVGLFVTIYMAAQFAVYSLIVFITEHIMEATTFFPRENPLYGTYAFCAGILVLKVLAMAPLTVRLRFSKKVFSNPEDSKEVSNSKIEFVDPDVERVRRAHWNDLENIPAFLFISFMYIQTSPYHFIALNLIRLYTWLRVVHSVVYLAQIPQPARAAIFIAGLAITAYMGLHVVLYFL